MPKTTWRDPFARQTLVRSVAQKSEHPKMECFWCGAKSGRLWEYSVEHDSGRTGRLTGLFCSHSCFRSYYQR